MSTTTGVVEVEKEERLSRAWAIVFGSFLVGVLVVLSLIIASLPGAERTMVALGLTMTAIVFCAVGWIEQERSVRAARGLTFVGMSLAAAVLDGTNDAEWAEWLIEVVGAAMVEMLVWLFSFSV